MLAVDCRSERFPFCSAVCRPFFLGLDLRATCIELGTQVVMAYAFEQIAEVFHHSWYFLTPN